MTISDHRDLVAALLGVPGVAAAAVEPIGDGPGTLRLQLASGADEVDVAGAVNRLLRSRFGLAVDSDRVRVVEESGIVPAADVPVEDDTTDGDESDDDESQDDAGTPAAGGVLPPAPEPAADAGAQSSLDDHAEPAPRPTGSARLVIDRVQLVSAGLGVTVSVTLRSGERSAVGEAEGAATTSALHRSVAAATLRAVEAVVEHQVRFDVEHVEIAVTGEERTALVVVSMLTERATQRLSGASVVREDVRQAVIRGVLAAVNRRVEPMLTEVAV
jgi:hypothetical protein